MILICGGGPMFVNCQNIAGSWGRDFVGNYFVVLQQFIIISNVYGDVNF